MKIPLKDIKQLFDNLRVWTQSDADKLDVRLHSYVNGVWYCSPRLVQEGQEVEVDANTFVEAVGEILGGLVDAYLKKDAGLSRVCRKSRQN